MVKLEGVALAGTIGGSLAVGGLLSCCGIFLCWRRRRRIQRRRTGEAERGRDTPRTLGSRQTPPAHDDLELGLRGGVVKKVETPPPPPPASPDQVDTDVGRQGRDIVRGVDPGRRSSSAPAELRRLVHFEPGQSSGGIAAAALRPSPHHQLVAAASPSILSGGDGFIDLELYGKRQGRWSHGAVFQAEGDGEGEIVDEVAAGKA